MEGGSTKVKVTGVYDAATVKAVKRFQSEHALLAFGFVGNATRDALNRVLDGLK